MSLKRSRSASPINAKSTTFEHETWVSSNIEDRGSTFTAYFSPTMPPKELQAKADLKSASHRMLAWRLPGSQRTLLAKSRALETGSDDDGERYGGKRVLKVLEEMRVEGALVVARWYGGVMLGPVRFNHIEDCAREAVRLWQQKEESDSQKRRKIENEACEKATLVSELQERDQSITVLRTLLGEKTRAAKGEEPPLSKDGDAQSPNPAARINYGSMALEILRKFDNARDRTVAFLLKKIDEVEKARPEVPPDLDADERTHDDKVVHKIDDNSNGIQEQSDGSPAVQQSSSETLG